MHGNQSHDNVNDISGMKNWNSSIGITQLHENEGSNDDSNVLGH